MSSTGGAERALIERTTDVNRLAAALAAARDGHGTVTIIEGPAGIGKTRLLESARELARAGGMELAVATGSTLEVDLPYGMVRSLFEPLVQADRGDELLRGAAAPAVSLIRGAAGEDGLPGAVLPAIHWMAVALAERSPLLIACDDAQWFDPSSLRALGYLANRLADLPIAMVLAARPDARGSGGEMLATLTALPFAQRLLPAPLSAAGVATLVQRALGDRATVDVCAAVTAASGGNPFFTEELLRTLRRRLDDGDAGLAVENLTDVEAESAVLARLGRLRPAPEAVAVAVAVLGTDADIRHVAALADLEPDQAADAADQLAAAEILTAARPLQFVHPLVGSAIYNRLPPGRRSVLHRRASAALTAEGAPAERIVAHLIHCEPAADDAVVDVLLTTAAGALRYGATEVAIAHLRRALAEPPAPERRLGVQLQLGVAESLIHDPAAIEHLGAAAAMIDDPDVRLTLWLAQAAVMTTHGRWPEAVAVLDHATSTLGDEGVATVLQQRLRAARAIAASIGRIPAADFAAAFAAVRAAELVGDPPAEVFAAKAFAAALGGDAADVVADFVAGALRRLDQHDPMLPLWFHLVAAALTMVDRDRQAADLIDARLTAARRAGAPTQVSVMLFQRGVIALRAGELDDAENDARQALEICHTYGLDAVVAGPVAVLVDVLHERDRLGAAQAVLDDHGFGHDPFGGTSFGTASLSLFELLVLAARARLRAAQGRWEESIADFTYGAELSRAAGFVSPGFVAWDAQLADAMVQSGLTTTPTTVAGDAVAAASMDGSPRAWAEAARSLAMTGAGSPIAFDEAAAIFERLDAKLELIRTWIARSFAADARESSAALDATARALALADAYGATRLARLSRERIRALGGTRRDLRPVSGPAALTASERRAAALAADGLSNKEIAQSLFVSVKTVETHLARAFRKLAVGGRNELRAALARPPDAGGHRR